MVEKIVNRNYSEDIIRNTSESFSKLPKDLEIITSDNKTISISKFLLSFHSPFMCSLLNSQNSNSDVIILPDINSSTINHLFNVIKHGISATSNKSNSKKELDDLSDSAKALQINVRSIGLVSPEGLEEERKKKENDKKNAIKPFKPAHLIGKNGKQYQIIGRPLSVLKGMPLASIYTPNISEQSKHPSQPSSLKQQLSKPLRRKNLLEQETPLENQQPKSNENSSGNSADQTQKPAREESEDEPTRSVPTLRAYMGPRKCLVKLPNIGIKPEYPNLSISEQSTPNETPMENKTPLQNYLSEPPLPENYLEQLKEFENPVEKVVKIETPSPEPLKLKETFQIATSIDQPAPRPSQNSLERDITSLKSMLVDMKTEYVTEEISKPEVSLVEVGAQIILTANEDINEHAQKQELPKEKELEQSSDKTKFLTKLFRKKELKTGNILKDKKIKNRNAGKNTGKDTIDKSKTVNKADDFRCQLCSFTCSNRVRLQRHYIITPRNHFKEEILKMCSDSEKKCLFCTKPKIFTRTWEIIQHLVSVHDKLNDFLIANKLNPISRNDSINLKSNVNKSKKKIDASKVKDVANDDEEDVALLSDKNNTEKSSSNKLRKRKKPFLKDSDIIAPELIIYENGTIVPKGNDNYSRKKMIGSKDSNITPTESNSKNVIKEDLIQRRKNRTTFTITPKVNPTLSEKKASDKAEKKITATETNRDITASKSKGIDSQKKIAAVLRRKLQEKIRAANSTDIEEKLSTPQISKNDIIEIIDNNLEPEQKSPPFKKIRVDEKKSGVKPSISKKLKLNELQDSENKQFESISINMEKEIQKLQNQFRNEVQSKSKIVDKDGNNEDFQLSNLPDEDVFDDEFSNQFLKCVVCAKLFCDEHISSEKKSQKISEKLFSPKLKKCPTCEQSIKCKDKMDFKNHKKSCVSKENIFKEIEEDKESFQCKFCSQDFKMAKLLKFHNLLCG